MAERAPRSTFRILDGHGHICLIAPNLDLAAIIGQWRNTPSRVPLDDLERKQRDR